MSAQAKMLFQDSRALLKIACRLLFSSILPLFSRSVSSPPARAWKAQICSGWCSACFPRFIRGVTNRGVTKLTVVSQNDRGVTDV
jgi:hypothetical protein